MQNTASTGNHIPTLYTARAYKGSPYRPLTHTAHTGTGKTHTRDALTSTRAHMPTEETVSRSHTTRKAGHTDSLVPAMPTPHTLTPDTCHDHDPDASRLLISREATPVAHMLPRIQPLLRRPSRLGTHTHTHTHTHTSALTAQREESALSLPVHAHSARWPADRPTLRRTHAIACRCTRRSAAQSALYRA